MCSLTETVRDNLICRAVLVVNLEIWKFDIEKIKKKVFQDKLVTNFREPIYIIL